MRGGQEMKANEASQAIWEVAMYWRVVESRETTEGMYQAA